MLNALILIFTCQLIGESAARAFQLPVPGPVTGMVLLFLFLTIRGGIPEDLAKVTDGLLSHLAVLFVPASVGVMLHFRLIGEEWLPILAAVVASTVATIAVTAWMMQKLTRSKDDENG